jgi:hypothetical protein
MLRDSGFDFTRQTILAGPIAELPLLPRSTPTPAEWGAGGEVRLAGATANTRQLDVNAPAPGLLVVGEMYAPGWRAWVDGRAAAMYRAGGNLQAVPVPAGAHAVRLAYLPANVVAGAAISLATVVALAGWAAVACAWGRRD